ncbi:MAG: class IV adenylate cyclase [Thermoguttaceae bacterium]|nr:class IV adenylate cyclase [Thermoguttaceae bacterium]MDW8039223.1 class IV adenylate cyclase [Thermoguttaceae bacterium]
MRLEVELKFPVEDLQLVAVQLRALGGEIGPLHEEVDRYYAHPARDFAQTDEALRIRQKGGQCWLTYKGPKIDPASKTRREIDLPLPDGPDCFAAWDELLQALGFQPVAEVRKKRRKAFLDWQGHRVETSLDEVAELGSFVELELVCDPANLEAARSALTNLADRLGLQQSQRRSYLELLLEKRSSSDC